MSKPSFTYTPLLLPVRWPRFRHQRQKVARKRLRRIARRQVVQTAIEFPTHHTVREYVLKPSPPAKL